MWDPVNPENRAGERCARGPVVVPVFRTGGSRCRRFDRLRLGCIRRDL